MRDTLPMPRCKSRNIGEVFLPCDPMKANADKYDTRMWACPTIDILGFLVPLSIGHNWRTDGDGRTRKETSFFLSQWGTAYSLLPCLCSSHLVGCPLCHVFATFLDFEIWVISMMNLVFVNILNKSVNSWRANLHNPHKDNHHNLPPAPLRLLTQNSNTSNVLLIMTCMMLPTSKPHDM